MVTRDVMHGIKYLILPGISSDGDREEFVNESATLESLGLAVPLLKLTERRGNQDEKLLNAEISNLIGKRLHEFDVMGAEVVRSLIIKKKLRVDPCTPSFPAGPGLPSQHPERLRASHQ